RNGQYHFACPLDEMFFEFVGLNPEALKEHLSQGFGDQEVLAWIRANAKHFRTEPEIRAWSDYAEGDAPETPESREHFNDLHRKAGPQRADIVTWFDLLDLDDYVSFGGKP